jgi:hypothetical protein
MFNRISVLACCTVLSLLSRTTPGSVEEGFSRPLSLSVNDVAAADAGDTRGSIARDTTFRFRAFGIYSSASGSLDTNDQFPLIPSDLDFEETLGLDLDEFSGGALVGFNFGSDHRWHFDVGFNGYYDYEGTKDVGTIEFEGEVYTADVKSRLRAAEGFAAINYDVWLSDAQNLTLNLGLDVHLFYVKAQLTEVLGTQSDSLTVWAPVPAPGIGLRWDITRNIYVRGKAAGLWLGDLGDFYDLSAELGYDFARNFGVFIGYRYWGLRLDYSDTELEWDANRVYAGIELRM